MKKPRLFSLLTAAVLTATGFWQNAALTASAEPGFTGAALPNCSAIAMSNNSFGDMIADTINQENSRIMMNSVVHGVVMNNTEAVVNIDSTRDGKAVVCIYEDRADGIAPQLLGTGIQPFSAEQKSVTVPVQMDRLPQYYLVRAFLIGENDIPLSAEFTDSLHTRDMQRLLQSDITDFTEDYEVLNLDASKETNFAVYKKNVKVLQYSEEENCVLTQDTENCVFEIYNYTGPTAKGRTVSVECGNGTAAIFKIASVTTEGDITTIQGDSSLDTTDAFAYLKMEINDENNKFSYEAPELTGEYAHIPISGEVISDSKPTQGRPAIAAAAAADTEAENSNDNTEDDITNFSGEKMFRIQLGKGEEYKNSGNDQNKTETRVSVEINGIVEFAFSYDISIYHTGMFDHIELDYTNTVDYGFEMSANSEIRLPLGDASLVNPCSWINFRLGPYFVASVTGFVRLTGTLETNFNHESGVEVHPYIADFSLSAEGFIGFGIGGELGVLGKGGELDLKVGFKVGLEPNAAHKGCQTCYNATLSLEGGLEASVDLGILDIGISPTIGFSIGNGYISDSLGFGFGECPNVNRAPEGENQSFTENPNAENFNTDLFSFERVNDGYALGAGTTETTTDELIFPSYYNGVPVVEIRPGVLKNFNNYTNTKIKTIKWPEKLKRIGDGAFNSNAFFRFTGELKFPDTLEEIGYQAFIGGRFSSVEFPASLNYMGRQAFGGCAELKSVKFNGSNLSTIPPYAFSGCTKLTDITWPENLKHIGDCAFIQMPEKPLTFPPTLQTIGSRAFVCDYPPSASTPEERGFESYDLTIPASILEIGEAAFAGRCFIDNITISDFTSNSLKLSWLNNLYVLNKIKLPSNWTYIPSSAFKRCRAKNITLPSNLQTIAPYAFEEMWGLESIEIPDSVTKIGKGAFAYCCSLKEITLPRNSLFTEIPDECFLNCAGLGSLSLPSSVTKIGRYAFKNCPSLTNITIPKEVSSMYFDAFIGYTKNNEVWFQIYEYYDRETGLPMFDGTAISAQSVRTITFYNPNIRFLDSPQEVAADYIPAGSTNKVWDYSLFKLVGYQGSTAEIFAQNPDHECKFIQLATTHPSIPTYPSTPSDTPQSITFDNLLPNTVYNFYDLLGEELTAENLLYLSQGVSDENGTLTIWYRPKSDDTDAKKYVQCAVTSTTEQLVSQIKGDTNCDFVVDVSDVVMCARFCAEDRTVKITRQGILNADVDKNGNPDPGDTILMLKFIARLITSFD